MSRVFQLIKRLAISAVLIASVGATGAFAQDGGDPIRETHGDWEIRCRSEPAEICYMSQLVRDGEGRGLLEISLAKAPEGGQQVQGQQVVARAEVLLPLPVFLAGGLRMKIDEGPVVPFSFFQCAQVGCFSEFSVTDEAVGQFKAGNTATFAVLRRPRGEPVQVIVSLSGFTAAYDAL